MEDAQGVTQTTPTPTHDVSSTPQDHSPNNGDYVELERRLVLRNVRTPGRCPLPFNALMMVF